MMPEIPTRAVAKPGPTNVEHGYYLAAAIGIVVVVLAGFSIDLPLLSHLGTLSLFLAANTSWNVDANVVRDLLIVGCIVVDTWRTGRLHPTFVSGGMLALANDYVAIWAAGMPAWTRFASWVVS
jgi:hypothetical protein